VLVLPVLLVGRLHRPRASSHLGLPRLLLLLLLLLAAQCTVPLPLLPLLLLSFDVAGCRSPAGRRALSATPTPTTTDVSIIAHHIAVPEISFPLLLLITAAAAAILLIILTPLAILILRVGHRSKRVDHIVP
jgi:hypothetical protein